MAHSFRAAGAAGRELFALSAPSRAPRRSTLMRGLRLIGMSLVALYTAALGAGMLAEALPQSSPVFLVLAVAQAVPIIMVLYRPLAAWWLSLITALPYLVLVGLSAAGEAERVLWPWSAAGMIAHVTVSLVVAWQVPPPVYLAQWAITGAVAGAAEVAFSGRAQDNNGLLLSGCYAVVLVVVAIVRWLRDVRRELRRQVDLTEQERVQRTALEERTRIARELHDVVAHHMSVIAVQAEAAPYRVSGLDPAATDSFASIRQNALAAMTEMRQILGMLRSAEDDGTRYAPQPALADLDQLFDNCRSAGLTLRTAVRGAVRVLPEQTELIAYRVVQEALSNVIRHAPGADVEVDLDYGPVDLRLRIANSPAPAAAERPTAAGAGHGLTGMQERAAVLGATLQAGHRADGWYEVTMSLTGVDR
ncbi:sensor histidine kinase [Actinoplanes sp. NPDC051859]|uniref:sensor histidine kinase n=1 Tax=Actinoplanes sp. NPDC051859 TaxID=3363909 RepID=UPI0037B4904F